MNSFFDHYENELVRRKSELAIRQRLEDETEKIPGAVDREIAQIIREQEAKDARRGELERLREIAKANADLDAVRQYSDRVAKAFEQLLQHPNLAAAKELDKQLRNAAEEERLLMEAAKLLFGLN